MQDKIKNILDDPFAQAIVKIFFSPNLILKIFLVIFVISSTTLASYMTINVIIEYLNRLVEDKKLLLSDTHTSIFSLAKGDKVWKLLYKLSEYCVTICINHRSTNVTLPNSTQHIGMTLTYSLNKSLTHLLTHYL
jgi:hypothetical protein